MTYATITNFTRRVFFAAPRETVISVQIMFNGSDRHQFAELVGRFLQLRADKRAQHGGNLNVYHGPTSMKLPTTV